MKTILIWVGVFLLMCFVISLPIMEENHRIKEDPHYLDHAYELKNNFDTTQVRCETVNTQKGTDYLN